MEIYGKRLFKVSTDLNLDKPFIKGQAGQVIICRHFSTDGNAAGLLFYNDNDLRDGMNRVYKLLEIFFA